MLRLSSVLIATTLAFGLILGAQQDIPVPVSIRSGTPLRIYLTKRVSYREGSAVTGKLVEPIWGFDRIVVPAGATLEGRVTKLAPVSTMMRATAIVRGDFTPLKHAQVTFSTLILPSGQRLGTDTLPTVGLASIYVPPKPNPHPKPSAHPKPNQSNPNAKSSQLKSLARQQAQQQIQSRIDARSYGFLSFVRGPNKREWLEDFFWGKLPYHPQRYRTGTRFDAVLNRPLDFGTVNIPYASLKDVGTQRAPDTPAMVQLVNTVTSGDARVGDPIKGVLSQPLFTPDHHLILPAGTDLEGKITMARRARMFHRGGQLRFRFDEVLPPTFLTDAMAIPHVERTQAQLTAAEPGSGSVTVDSEGTAKATESKTRFLRPVIAGLIAARAADNDASKQNASGGANANYSGHALGGFSGFGLLGTGASFGPSYIGTAIGYYGLAWSVYSNIISRGREVTFEKNSAIAIRFGAPTKDR